MPTRILLVGAGAIGTFYASRLANLPHIAVSALCRSNFTAVQQHGFQITSPNFGEYVFRPEYTFGRPEEARTTTRRDRLVWNYLIVATKALPDVSDDSELLEDLVGDETTIVLVQNGLGVEEPYRQRFPAATIVSGVTIASCAQPAHGKIKHNRWTRISLGPYLPHLDSGARQGETLKDDTTAKERNRQLVELLQQAGIEDAVEYDHAGLQFVRWHKVAINASMNPTTVLAGGCTTQGMSQDPSLAEHMRGVMEEVLAVAPKVLGRPLPTDLATPEQILMSTSRNSGGSRPSMWMDWEDGKRMELEVILGNPLRMAQAQGIAMPRVQTMYAALKMAQQMRMNADLPQGKSHM